jgi:penicillin-insensitive murein DD-endopeptidase
MALPHILWICFPLLFAAPAGAAQSTCRGTPSKGALEHGCQLPAAGANFTSYSELGRSLNRTYVHCTVGSIVTAAYARAARQLPDVRFVYGETGLPRGGPFAPHKTHQNGLSVDFFVPVRDREGRSVPLPTTSREKWGYEIEFDGRGRYGDLAIDFEAITVHVLALHEAARQRGVRISRIIFDPQLQPLLHQAKSWPLLAGRVRFSTAPSWVRHDEHYHVDFDIPCEPL